MRLKKWGLILRGRAKATRTFQTSGSLHRQIRSVTVVDETLLVSRVASAQWHSL